MLPRTKTKKSLKMLNNLTHYSDIFAYNKRKDKTILLLKKIEFDIFYSCKLKYPILVAETVTPLTGKTDPNEPFIDRRKIEDPFREDLELPTKCRHTLTDYQAYMEYGGSMGHNAAAGQHKTNIEIFNETFLLSNIAPQEMVLNSGLWVLMENWCKMLHKMPTIRNIRIFTGSIPEEKAHDFHGVKMNIPIKMFKIVCFELLKYPNMVFMEIFLVNNSAYYVNPNTQRFDLTPFLVATKSHVWFQKFTGISIQTLLTYYGYSIKSSDGASHSQSSYGDNIKPFRNVLSMEISLSPAMRLLMKKSNWFGHLIYSTSLNQLEYKWEQCMKLEQEFETLQYHKEFYELTKKRLLRDKDDILDLMSFKHGSKLFSKYNKSTTSTHLTKKHI